ncbi:WD40-repeat-containing domain protein [Aspergillus egyptiacus]|nr:WD40-repeat-containing domain protein [Aspergillus egyptiacus]
MDMGNDQLTARYSTPASLLGSEDPSMIRESEDLLSRFMRCSSNDSQNTQDASPQNHDHIPQESSSDSVVVSSPKPRIRIPRGNVQLRPHNSPRVSSGARVAPVIDYASSEQFFALPSRGEKQTTHSRRENSRSPSSSSDVPKPPVIRRSVRSRAGPTNYYKKVHINSESREVAPPALREPIPRAFLQRHRSAACSASPTHFPPRPIDQAIKRRNASLSSFIQQRELGYCPRKLQFHSTSSLRPYKSWKGASNDVITLAWSPDGTRFAAGATAQCDEHMRAYNRKNNLLFGDLVSNELHELSEHCRPFLNSNGSTSTMGDPRLFMSVTAVQWFGDTLYTASYDHTVKLWDTSRKRPSCYNTLEHDSKVIVMARSNFAENLLATGSRTIRYWNTNSEKEYKDLETTLAGSRKGIELVPTSIAWGATQATKDFLLAGLSEKEDGGVAQHGLLAAYRFREDSAVPVREYFSPNSQNVFDIKWHPVLSMFATACTAGQQVSRGTRSVVNLYEPLRLKSRVMELECPALDMNEAVFCPWDTNYVSASCTDGITYVWDLRKSGEILHHLKHGDPLNQLDETIPREQADTGVNLHLWGSTYDQLYTGASDGALKRWNILRSPDDALVEEVATFQEGIMCGAFSPDKTNLLVGDVSGGVQLLSNSPFSPEDTCQFKFQPSKIEQDFSSDSGVQAARDLVSTRQIERHPVFGPGQGPNYKGPFAAWARPDGTPPELLAATGLAENLQIRQLAGLPPKYRKGLSPMLQKEIQAHISLAKTRNQRSGDNKRRNGGHSVFKTEMHDESHFVASFSEDDEVPHKRKQHVSDSHVINKDVVPVVIDLTLDDSDTESPVSSVILRGKKFEALEPDDLEDDFWWPDSSKIDPNWPED